MIKICQELLRSWKYGGVIQGSRLIFTKNTYRITLITNSWFEFVAGYSEAETVD